MAFTHLGRRAPPSPSGRRGPGEARPDEGLGHQGRLDGAPAPLDARRIARARARAFAETLHRSSRVALIRPPSRRPSGAKRLLGTCVNAVGICRGLCLLLVDDRAGSAEAAAEDQAALRHNFSGTILLESELASYSRASQKTRRGAREARLAIRRRAASADKGECLLPERLSA
jgi:hypothetical protein